MSGRSYEGPALDGTVQYITERPAALGSDGETVDATPDPAGREETVGVPELEAAGDVERPDTRGQTTWTDWGCGDGE
ncbi:hypothetical protein Hbl1158_02745 [Halobaculum sp. CBA1158]|uniref:hypothetical protein n=1 Tax=Halobaculum sp. CBA1158 TaxID=2904243 RepID=UPI001F212FDD|nr:hypothetical protein [Halobaculum sp. CBA1158]UIP00306.1 hypothetical protein Hbl1158_02745 [Halobaculum sp. CBA1158]